MTITGIESNNTLFTGNLIFEELSDEGQFSIRDAINADLVGLLPEGNIPVAAASWGLSVKILSYDMMAVKTMSGFPLRAQFGSITYYSVVSFIETAFIQHVFQTFRPQRCLVAPITYGDVPFTTAELPGPSAFETLTTVSYLAVTTGLYMNYDTFVGATGFYYDFPESVVASVSVPYIVRYADLNPGADEGNTLIFNY